ncbi:exonuclease SbcCD subunit D [Enterococcus sp.]|uniref:exonuclease SbcCD subunit D n=1 Tax=Enterococcus sp. TaxID=35783 RepID=UPI00289A7804|nr:exonuclease SbcCD subunit D [Enterococcus sp.]
MRILHTADWHIGKKLHGYDLIEDQSQIIDQIIDIALAQEVEAVVIAGDLYDRSVPAVEAVKLLNEKIATINLTHQLPLLVISGNHDSPIRLETGKQWFTGTQFHMATSIEDSLKPVTIADSQFFLLPYFEPIEARLFFDEPITTIAQGVVRVIDEMKAHADPSKKQILVTHFFAAGSSQTDSETKIQVGGLDSVPLDAFDRFDRVLLGHLHSKHALNHPRIKYSGSPLKYSLSEWQEQKGVYIIDTHADTCAFMPLHPARDIYSIEATFAELTDPAFYMPLDRQAFWHFTLTDRTIIPNMMNQLRKIYPTILAVERLEGPVKEKKERIQIETNDPQTLINTFFHEMTGNSLMESQQQWIEQGLSEVLTTEKRVDH